MMPELKYRKLPIEVEAIRLERRFSWPHWFHEAVNDFRIITHGLGKFGEGVVYVQIHTPEGVMRGDEGDYIIRGVKGEIYPCKPDIFALTYEPATRPDGGDSLREAAIKRIATFYADLERVTKEPWTLYAFPDSVHADRIMRAGAIGAVISKPYLAPLALAAKDGE